MTGARLRLLALGLLALLTTGVVPTTSPALAATDNPALTDSASTRSGSGRFADLDVTVGKTANLGNEAVRVSWQWQGNDPGSHATRSDTGWNYNYLTVFQCWGDGADGPDREQCQYGGQFSNQEAGTNQRLSPFNADPDKGWALSRAVSPKDAFGHTIVESTDPLEYSRADGVPATSDGPGIVPMHSSPTAANPNGARSTSIDTGEFFDLYGTNEVPLARTNFDGSGQVYVELQTVYESQFLGCGARTESASGSVTGKGCYLVVVPRDQVDSDGTDVTTRAGSSDRALFSSPLSLSNWKNRITFPLDFEPVREPCALGGTERPVVGHESLSGAMTSWQGPLCAGGQGYFYASTSDDIARQNASSALPKYSVVTEPLPPGTKPAKGGSLVYAPTAVSGVSVSFFIERAYSSQSPPEYRPYTGTRVEKMRLSPRLVAKLLTQSYRLSTVTIDGGPAHLQDAPRSLIDDPEFLALNDFTKPDGSPDRANDLTHLTNQRDSLAKINVTADQSDAVRLVWEWILADDDARAFLAGQPDQWGMTVNKYFKGLDNYGTVEAPRADIPRLDGVCIDASVGFGNGETRPVCPLDAVPYVASLDNGAALTLRGQTLGSQSWVKDLQSGFVKPLKSTPQLVGQRALITLTDTPSAQRRGLVSASLLNASGTYLPPSSEAMSTAVTQAVDTATPGVLRVPSEKVNGNGYPLTRISYGVTNPALLTQEARDDYAAFATYAATDGQVPGTRPGQLPVGYAPLSWPLRITALKAADSIRTAKSPAATSASPTAKPTTTLAPSATTTPRPTTSVTASPDPSDDTGGPTGDNPAGSGSGVIGGVGSLPSAGAVPPAAGSPSPAASASAAKPLEVQRVSAITPTVGVGLLRWLLPLIAVLGVAAALASRVMVRRGGSHDS